MNVSVNQWSYMQCTSTLSIYGYRMKFQPKGMMKSVILMSDILGFGIFFLYYYHYDDDEEIWVREFSSSSCHVENN